MAEISASLPTTSNIDIQRLYSTDVNSTEFKELLVRLWQIVNKISVTTNMKDTGYYTETEFINSQFYFPDPTLAAAGDTNPRHHPVYRTVVNFGALPDTALKQVAHGITFTDTTIFTRLYGAASDKTATTVPLKIRHYIPIPQSNIELSVDDTYVNITTSDDKTAYTECYVVLEYLK